MWKNNTYLFNQTNNGRNKESFFAHKAMTYYTCQADDENSVDNIILFTQIENRAAIRIPITQ